MHKHAQTTSTYTNAHARTSTRCVHVHVQENVHAPARPNNVERGTYRGDARLGARSHTSGTHRKLRTAAVHCIVQEERTCINVVRRRGTGAEKVLGRRPQLLHIRHTFVSLSCTCGDGHWPPLCRFCWSLDALGDKVHRSPGARAAPAMSMSVGTVVCADLIARVHQGTWWL